MKFRRLVTSRDSGATLFLLASNGRGSPEYLSVKGGPPQLAESCSPVLRYAESYRNEDL